MLQTKHVTASCKASEAVKYHIFKKELLLSFFHSSNVLQPERILTFQLLNYSKSDLVLRLQRVEEDVRAIFILN